MPASPALDPQGFVLPAEAVSPGVAPAQWLRASFGFLGSTVIAVALLVALSA